MQLTGSFRPLSFALLAASLVGCADDDSTATPSDNTTTGSATGDETASPADSSSSGEPVPATCSEAALEALGTCVARYGDATRACYEASDAACASDDASTATALDDLQASIEASCGDAEFLSLSTDAVVGRLRNACESEASSLAWRTFGGPQGAVWPEADANDRACLASAHETATGFVFDSLGAIGQCLGAGDCDAGTLQGERDALLADAQSAIEGACGDMSAVIAVSPATYVERAAGQVDCLTASGHPAPGDIGLECGPTHAQFTAPRGEWTQIVVDSEQWGTQCGDGSDYAFQIQLAPEGQPLDRVLIGLQGGGVCLFEDDCTARMMSQPGLFNAMDDEPIGLGIASDDPNVSEFANWTKIYLPYCNQDVFAGGGVDEELGDLSLPRYGAVNLRAAVQMTRDVIWQMMDEQEGGDGFRPDEVVAFFGGWSAGAYGTLYNYHWLLDDLQWPRTIAFPDAGLALDNGSTLGVSGLGLLKIPAWGTVENLPPYCFAGECAVGPVIYDALSPRLKQVPEQQMLILSNPVDATQQGDAFFDDEAFWINTMRQSYCDTRDLPGISYYFTSVSDQSVHVVSIRPDLWVGEVDGETMRDWFSRAVEDPDSIVSRVEEADFVEAVPGVEPYPCEVPG
ncbi:MAG: pectin acetylesterase-family hydrolase [Myxococcota bacterium]